MLPNYPLARHSSAGGNPARTNNPRSGQNRDVAPLRGRFFNHLDSRLRGNDAVLCKWTIWLKSKILLWLLLLTGTAHAAPLLTLGTSDNYCVVTCYIRIPFTITQYESTRNIGMVYCDVDAEVTSAMPAYDGQIRTRNLQQSPIGIFKNTAGAIKGDVEVDTGIRKKNFRDARVKAANCHL